MHSEYFYITIIFIIVISIVIFTVNSDSCGGAEEKYSNNYVNSIAYNNNLGSNDYITQKIINSAIGEYDDPHYCAETYLTPHNVINSNEKKCVLESVLNYKMCKNRFSECYNQLNKDVKGCWKIRNK